MVERAVRHGWTIGIVVGRGTPVGPTNCGREKAKAPVTQRTEGDHDTWLTACRVACDGISAALRAMSPAERSEPIAAGAGGDTTLRVDRVAEDMVVETLTATGLGFHLVSEELGETDVNGGGTVTVVVDPIDGSLNASRGMTPFSTCIAIADGPTMADVFLGYVRDHGTGEEFLGLRGRGAWVDDAPIAISATDDRLELLLMEGASPRLVCAAALAFDGYAARLRAVGSLALSLCYTAAGRGDAMIGLGRGRAVDVAAAQLIAVEAGLLVGMPTPADRAGVALDLDGRHHIVAARRPEALDLKRSALPVAGGAA